MKRKLSASNIVKSINRLPKDRTYNYPTTSTKTELAIVRVVSPEGPIIIKRFGTKKAPTLSDAVEDSISVEMIWRIANAFVPGVPINFDRVLGGSYNTRSALEALMLHTSEFYTCKPGRLEILNTTTQIKDGHKHIVWRPDEPHEAGLITHFNSDLVVSEASLVDTVHEAVQLPILTAAKATPQDIENQRVHAQIQVTLVEIGKQLGYRTWVAKNDHGIIYKKRKIIEMEEVITSLSDEKLLKLHAEAVHAGQLIDCI